MKTRVTSMTLRGEYLTTYFLDIWDEKLQGWKNHRASVNKLIIDREYKQI